MTADESQTVFENMKWNKSLKIVNPVPQFQSVPATAHVFDLAGMDLQYESLETEAAQFQIKSSMFGKIGSFFGRGRWKLMSLIEDLKIETYAWANQLEVPV